MRTITTKRSPLALAVFSATVALGSTQLVLAQTDEGAGDQPTPQRASIQAPVIEEVLTIGRLQSSADSIVDERLEQAFSADVLGFDQISRAGDADIASALGRVTGLTVVDDQYVYVRSLGERYSTVNLNGASVPSPELTRNVLPLDLFPSTIVKTLKVQKAYSPDLPATFGGGNVNIRTKGMPEDLVFDVSVGTGWNTVNSDDGIFYSGGDIDNGVPAELSQAITLYQGNITTNDIAQSIVGQGQAISSEVRAQAQQINRDLMLSLDRNVEITPQSLDPDYGGKVSLGNSWYVGDDWSVGGLANLSYDHQWRNKNQTTQGIGNPDQVNSEIQRTSEESRTLASVSGGVSFQEMHTIEASLFYITDIEDRAVISRGYDQNNQESDGSQILDYQTRYEERRLTIGQFTGDHNFEFDLIDAIDEVGIDWYYSDSRAETAIPSEVNITGSNVVDPATGEVLQTRLQSTTNMTTFGFLQLEDNVTSYGYDFELPMNFGDNVLTLTAGYDYSDKTRAYYGYTAAINAPGVSSEALAGTPGEVLGDENLGNLDYNFDLTMDPGLGTESYIAAQKTDAAYAMFDLNIDYTWRLTGGARYENFRQALLPVNMLDYSGSYLEAQIEDLENNPENFIVEDESWYPSLALTFMDQGFMGADDFQIRASMAQTVVRPDLREMSEVQYLDPDLDVRVEGNPNLEFSELDHFDLRTEWFYPGGDNFTISLFYKDIVNPIEQARVPGSDDSILLTYYNAESGEIYGLEFEGLKDIGAGFFVSGNLTLSDSEIVSPEGQGFTNTVRRMTGQSEYVMNAQLGFDSEDGMHTASLLYNVFGDRVYYAAVLDGHDDAFEQPYHSLDLVYTFYPTDTLSMKIKLSNLLDQDREFEQVNSGGESVNILTQEQGVGMGLDFKYSF